MHDWRLSAALGFPPVPNQLVVVFSIPMEKVGHSVHTHQLLLDKVQCRHCSARHSLENEWLHVAAPAELGMDR